MDRVRSARAAAEGVAIGAVVLLAWQYGAVRAGIPEYVLPTPAAIASRFWQTLPLQLEHLTATAVTTLAGLALALAGGVLLALACVYVARLRRLVLPALATFNGIPKVAIAPLFVIWFGVGSQPKVLLAFLMALFPVFVGGVRGLGDIEPDLIDLARLLGGTEARVFRKVRIMHALPYLTDAVKVAFPLAIVGSIVGEFIGGNQGIGYLILSGQFNLDAPLVFACLLSITIFTGAGIGIVDAIERVFLAWRPARRREST
jgi:NitT/TauT family transport system permease protein